MMQAASRCAVVFVMACLLAPGAQVLAAAKEGVVANEKASQEVEEASQEKSLPLAPDKTLTITTDEVTWLSLDVSPSGEQMVIEVLGNLYLLPIAGGEAQPLSVGMSFDSQPRFSPDGERIVFLSDRDGGEEVWVIELATGETERISKAGSRAEFASPTWSPDGEFVLASRSSWSLRTFELWLYPLDGGDDGVQVTQSKARSDTPSANRHNALGAVYDPTGRYVYYARKNGGFGYNNRFPLWQIARRDLKLGTEDRVTQAVGSAFRPALSPDGKWLVYGTRHEQGTGLRIRNLATTEDTWLAYPVQRDEQEGRFTRDLLPGYAFTPDGSQVIASRDGRIVSIDVATRVVREIPFEVTVEQPVAERLHFPWRTGLGPVKARILADVQLSPDGKYAAFGTFGRVYVTELESGVSEPISPEGMVAAFPAWSPNGREIAYASWSAQGGHVYRQRPRAGARARQLTQASAYYSYPAWSPDGERVVALRESTHERLQAEGRIGPGPGADVIWLPSKGGEARLILPARGYSRPHFGPEPDRVYFQIGGPIPRKLHSGLVSVRYDGTDLRSVMTVEGPGIYNQDPDAGAQSMQTAPDGRHVAFSHAGQLYVARLAPFLPAQKLKLKKPTLPLVKLTDVGADFIAWRGETLTWSIGNTIYTRALSDMDFAEAERAAADKKSNGEEEEADDELLEDHPSVSSHAIDIYLPRHGATGVVALTNATALTMGAAGVVEGATVLVENDRITAVGSDIDIPEGADVFDLGGRYVVPGYVDTHAHFRVSREMPPLQNAAFLANLAYGVTTGMDVQPTTVDLLAAQDRVDAGLMLGPRAHSTGPGVFSNNEFRSKAHAINVLKRYKDGYRVRNLKAYISGSREQRQWLSQAARELKLMPTTEGALDMKLDLTYIVDGFSGVEHAFPVPTLHEDVIQLAAQTQLAYTPTLLVSFGGPWGENYFYTHMNPHDDAKLRRFTPYSTLAVRTLRRAYFHDSEYVHDEIAASARRIVEAGGQVGIGAHGQLQGLGFHWELWAMGSGDWDNLQLLRAATLMGAEMLGLEQDLGSLEPGKLADLVVLRRDPLQDIQASADLEYVMKGGELYEAETLDQVWPEVKPLPEPWWQRGGPEQLPTNTNNGE